MPRPCTVCRLPDENLKAANLALAAGKPANFVAQSFGVSVYAIQRHRTGHLQPRLVRAALRREDMSADALVERLVLTPRRSRSGHRDGQEREGPCGFGALHQRGARNGSLHRQDGRTLDREATDLHRRARQTVNVMAA